MRVRRCVGATAGRFMFNMDRERSPPPPPFHLACILDDAYVAPMRIGYAEASAHRAPRPAFLSFAEEREKRVSLDTFAGPVFIR